MNPGRDSRKLLNAPREQVPDCAGSGHDHATPGDAARTVVGCPTCGRRFGVRVIRSRDRQPLPQPTATVPRHRRSEPTP